MKKQSLFLTLTLFVSFCLRFLFLSKIPSELTRDEVSVGFNAYSILKTQKDEYGRGPWPLVFRAFGDYKIPGYVYLTAALIKVFGLNAFSVRFPAAFFGFLTVLMAYFFSQELFPQKKKLALIFSLLLAISPFHLHYSRMQYETTVALFFSLTGILLLLKARRKRKFLFLALPFFIFSFFIYNTPLFIIPPLCLWTFYVFRKSYFKSKNTKQSVVIFTLLLATGWVTYLLLVKEGNQGRANTTIFNQQEAVIQNEIPAFLGLVFQNKPVAWLKAFSENYLAAFNPKFIFFESDNNVWHSISHLGFGNLLLIFLPFLLMGIITGVKKLKEKNNFWLLGALLLSPVANGLTIDSPILTRLLFFHLLLVFFTALGVEHFLSWRSQLKAKNALLVVVFCFSVLHYLFAYFFVFPQSLDTHWLPGMSRVFQMVKQKEADYDLFVFDKDIDTAYIFAAFYMPFEPTEFQTQAQRVFDGFDRATSFKGFVFEQDVSEWYQPKDIEKGQRILIIERLAPGETAYKEPNNVLIYDNLGKPIWKLTTVTS